MVIEESKKSLNDNVYVNDKEREINMTNLQKASELRKHLEEIINTSRDNSDFGKASEVDVLKIKTIDMESLATEALKNLDDMCNPELDSDTFVYVSNNPNNMRDWYLEKTHNALHALAEYYNAMLYPERYVMDETELQEYANNQLSSVARYLITLYKMSRGRGNADVSLAEISLVELGRNGLKKLTREED